MIKEQAPNIPPYEHDERGYYVIDQRTGDVFRPLDIIGGGQLVALNATLVLKREKIRAGITTFPPGEPLNKQVIRGGNKELTHVA